MAPSLVDSMRRIVDEDDSNNNKDDAAAAILHCPTLIQEKYNRLHMIQHETRRTTARQSIRRPPSASSWRKQHQQQQQQQNDESTTTTKGNLNVPTKMLPLPSRVTRTSFDNRNNTMSSNTMMFGMLDQMLLDDHDDDDSSSSYTAASSFSGGSSDDDDYSCSSVASYNSLIFGDDGISSNITPSSFSFVNQKQNPNKDVNNDKDEEGEGDDTEFDDSETTINRDGEENDDEEEVEEGAEASSCCGSSINSDVTVEDFLTVTSGGLGGRGRSKHDHQPYHSSDDDDVLCPLARQLIIKVPNNQKFVFHPVDSPLSSPTPSSSKSSSQYHNQNTKYTMNKMKMMKTALKSKNKKSVTWNNKASCKLIRHLNDYTNEEISKLFITSKEASKIRDGCYQVIQILEKEEEVLMEIQRTIQNGSGPDDATLDVATTFHRTLLDSIRGLERHTSVNNEKLHAKREQMYASVFKIQSLNLPPGLMDVPATIADVCTKLAEPSVQKAIQLAAKDELEAQRVYYGDAIAPSSASLSSPSPSPQKHHHRHRHPKVTFAGRRQPHVVGHGVMD